MHTDATEELDVAIEEDLPQKKADNIPEWPDGILDYLDETERNKVLEYACNLQISQSTRLHKMLVQYKKNIADYKSKLKEAQSRPYYNPRHNKPENEPELTKQEVQAFVKYNDDIKIFCRSGFHPKILLETNTLEVGKRVAVASGACMLMSNIYIDEFIRRKRGEFYPLKDYENYRHLYACHSKE